MSVSQHFMIDLETGGTGPVSAIWSIGACGFDPMTGEIGEKFYRRVDMASAMQFGRVDPETLRWWLRQADDARLEIAKKGEQLSDVLRDFSEFYNQGHDAKVWGNGSVFDITILESAYHRCLGQKAPWPFWNVRDVRTVVQLAEGLEKKPAAFTKNAVAHNALDDCIFQVGYVSKMWQALRGSKAAAPAAAADDDDFL